MTSAAWRTAASIASRRSASGWRRSTESSARPATAVIDAGLELDPARSCRRRRARGRSARPRARSPPRRGRHRDAGPSASSRRAMPARRSRAGSARRRRMPETAAQLSPLRVEDRALLDVELEAGADPADPLVRPRERDRDRRRGRPERRRSRCRRRPRDPAAPPGRASRRAPSCRTGCGRTAIPPRRRSRSGRGRGAAPGPDSAQARRTPSAAITPSAPSSGPPAGTESRWEPSASAGAPRSAPGSRAQRFPASSHLGRVDADRGEAVAEEVASRLPFRRPADAAGALRPAGQRGEVGEVGEHPPGVDRRRRSVAGSAQATRSRRSAWPRQWAPPPPSVNMLRSGS